MAAGAPTDCSVISGRAPFAVSWRLEHPRCGRWPTRRAWPCTRPPAVPPCPSAIGCLALPWRPGLAAAEAPPRLGPRCSETDGRQQRSIITHHALLIVTILQFTSIYDDKSHSLLKSMGDEARVSHREQEGKNSKAEQDDKQQIDNDRFYRCHPLKSKHDFVLH